MFCAADSSYTEYLTPDPKGTRFHSCGWDADCAAHEPNMISIHPKPTVNHSITEYVLSKHANLLQTDLPYTCKPFKRMVTSNRWKIQKKPICSLTILLSLCRFYLFLFIHLAQK